MDEPFEQMLAEGGKSNSLGRVNEVIALVLSDMSRLEELYDTMFHDDAWIRMRAADALEKICRQHPKWIQPYIDRIQNELSESAQPSIQWHIAQIYTQVKLSEHQKAFAIAWLKKLLHSVNVDWIVSANSMDTLAIFTRNGDIDKADLLASVHTQLNHKSKSVVKRAQKIITEFS